MNDSLDSNLQILKEIIARLNNIWKMTFEHGQQWLNLIYDFHMNKTDFAQGDIMVINCKITNPSSIAQIIYFKYDFRFDITINKHWDNDFSYHYPIIRDYNVMSPYELVVPAHSYKELSYQWDLNLEPENQQPLYMEPGEYYLSAQLHFSYSGVERYTIAIVDPAIPVTGVVVPDNNGSHSYSNSYIFKLKIRNWTENEITLNFPFGQKITVTLYDHDFPEPGPVIYTSTVDSSLNASMLHLSPSEEIIFEEIVTKDKIALNSFHTYIVIKLLCQEFEYQSDADIRIFKYRP